MKRRHSVVLLGNPRLDLNCKRNLSNLEGNKKQIQYCLLSIFWEMTKCGFRSIQGFQAIEPSILRMEMRNRSLTSGPNLRHVPFSKAISRWESSGPTRAYDFHLSAWSE